MLCIASFYCLGRGDNSVVSSKGRKQLSAGGEMMPFHYNCYIHTCSSMLQVALQCVLLKGMVILANSVKHFRDSFIGLPF